MSYLIIDTETNGVNPLTDKVIEIGGLIAEYDSKQKKLIYKDSYQSLIYLETGLDSRITDLTGITVDELNEAPKRTQIQAEWETFLQKYEITHVLGHSLDFDTRFLSSNGFALPKAYELDTLDFTKIVCPDTKAVNLDFLNKTYDLDKYFPKPQDLLDLQHHRALYDAFMCASLFNYLIDKTAKSNTSVDFLFGLDNFVQERLMLEVNQVDDNQVKLTLNANVNCLKKPMDETTQYLFSKIVENDQVFETINNIFASQAESKSPTYKKVLLSIWYGMLNVNKLGKIIINGGHEKKFYDLIIDTLQSSKSEGIENYNLFYPEEFILESKEVTTLQSSIRDISDYLDLYSDLRNNLDHEKGLLRINFQKILTSLRSINKTNFFNLDKINATIEQSNLVDQLDDYKSFLKELKLTVENHMKNTVLELQFLDKINSSIEIVSSNYISFFFFDNDVRMIMNRDFDLTKYLSSLIKDANTIETSLTPKEYLDFINLFGIEGNKEVNYGKTITEEKTSSLLDDLKASNSKVKIVFIGKSSNLKSFPQKLANAEIPFIDINNAGSATKILSAIEHGFEGIAILNYKNIDFVSNFLSNYKDDIDFYYYGDTFLPLSKSIKDLNKEKINPFEFDKFVSKLYLKFLLHKLFLKFEKTIKFYPEF
ncbi:MAG: 3'-5' exonuclease [Patescibacteria group bacterium]